MCQVHIDRVIFLNAAIEKNIYEAVIGYKYTEACYQCVFKHVYCSDKLYFVSITWSNHTF